LTPALRLPVHVCSSASRPIVHLILFSLTDTATTEFHPLSLHDALPISRSEPRSGGSRAAAFAMFEKRLTIEQVMASLGRARSTTDRKSTRLNSSHVEISYAVFCLKKKKKGGWTELTSREEIRRGCHDRA